jgi:LuxR family transcriptional regulator, maltose regulon positive regulatory protein
MLVSAPAGFGKTTLLTQWLADIRRQQVVAWVSLDERDNDAATYWTYVVTAMQMAADTVDDVSGTVGTEALGLLGTSQPSVEAALVTLLNDLRALPHEIVLVLDDYHVIASPDIHDGMSFLLDRLPPNAHLVLATRVDPPLLLSRLRARGELIEVRSADLRFTREEAAAYLGGPMRLALSDADVTTLADRTEGWAAALQLAALSLQDRENPSAVVASFAGDDRFIVDYLADEVLVRQSEEVRDFLLATSVLDRLTGSLCDAVTGQTDGAARLIELERANLFLVPLDDRRQWFRYHHLFADVLRATLGEQHPDRIAELHRRASRWLHLHGDAAEAVTHALAGKDVDGAADLMERAMPEMRRARREGELIRWIHAVPDEVVRVRPVLAMAFVGSLAQASDFDTLDRRLTDIERALRPDGGPWPIQPPAGLVVVDHDGYRSLPASVSTYRAALALVSGDLNATFAHAQEALTLVPADDDLVRAAAGALAGLASWARGDLAGAHAAYTQSGEGLRRIGHLADVLGLRITLGDIRCAQGRLGDAFRNYQEALELTAGGSGAAPLRGTADMHVGIAAVLLERDELTGAVEHLAACEQLGEHNGLPQNPYRRRVITARLRAVEGDLDCALDLLEEADRLYNGDYAPNVQPVPATRARLRLRRGELTDAELWVREQRLSPDDELSYLREYEHVTLARVLLARYAAAGDSVDLDRATALLDRLLAAAQRGGRDGTLIEILVLQALTERARGDLTAALASLQRALMLAEPERYVRIFADEGPPMMALLKILAKREMTGGTGAYIRRLLAATTRSRRPVPVSQGPLVEPLSDRELDVLRLLATDLDGPDIARHLHISLNTMRTHTRNIFRKLQVTSRRAAVSQAATLDLLPKQRGA